MFRAKIIATFAIFMGLFLGLTYVLVSSDFETQIRQSQTRELGMVANSIVEMNKVETASLHAKALFFASGVSLHGALMGEGATDEEGVMDKGQRHLKTHEKLRVQDITVKDIIKSAAGKVDGSRLPIESKLKVDIAFVLDNQGVGVAALGKDRYSWFGEDVSKSFPIIASALAGKWYTPKIQYWMWSFSEKEPKQLYEVAIAPVRLNANGRVAGVVVLGRAMDDGKAVRFAKKIFTDEEMKGKPEIAFLKGEAVVSSTLDNKGQSAFAAAISSLESGKIKIADAEYNVVSKEIGVFEEPIKVAVFSTPQLRPIESLSTIIIILGVVLIVIGISLLFFFLISFLKPLEELESGIHQVIAGNRDYVWEQKKGHALQSGFAQALNVMNAFLQGKPMPDDENPSGGWGDMPKGKSGGPAPKVQGVAIPGMAPRPKKKTE